MCLLPGLTVTEKLDDLSRVWWYYLLPWLCLTQNTSCDLCWRLVPIATNSAWKDRVLYSRCVRFKHLARTHKCTTVQQQLLEHRVLRETSN
jgi:hypothetical protein